MNVPPTYQMPPPSDALPPPKSGVPGWAKWVIGCGAMVMCCCPIGGGILFPVFSQARVAAKSTHSMSNLKRLATAWSIYLVDFDEMSTPAKNWNTNMINNLPAGESSTVDGVLIDPLLEGKAEQRGYGMNIGVAEKDTSRFLDPSKVIVYGLTTNPGKDALISPDTLRTASSFPFRTIWATADGAVTKGLIDGGQRFQWKPVLMKK